MRYKLQGKKFHEYCEYSTIKDLLKTHKLFSIKDSNSFIKFQIQSIKQLVHKFSNRLKYVRMFISLDLSRRKYGRFSSF